MENNESKFPVNIEMRGDDFNFNCDISMFMAGKIIEYVGYIREEEAKRYIRHHPLDAVPTHIQGYGSMKE